MEFMCSKNSRLAATPFGCGQCLPCRINKARMWTHRILLESLCHGDSCFTTLTYDDEHIPESKMLEKRDLQNFLKRLRHRYPDQTLRYFAVGEYGDIKWRPHYHLILFGVPMQDEKLIEYVWKRGHVLVGDVNKDSARYVTGYCTKKLTRKDDLRLEGRNPEFMLASRQNGGIGYPAIVEIAKAIRKEGLQQYTTTLRHGKVEMPLGRYLTEKLAELTNTSQKLKERSLFDHSMKYLEFQGKKTSAIALLEEELAPKVLSKEKREAIFKKKRKI